MSDETTEPVRSVAGATMLSRVLGLIRDKATVAVFSPALADAILLAWTIPNLFRKLFGEGALAAALVPALANAERDDGAAGRDLLASRVVTALTFVLAPLAFLFTLFLWLAPTETLARPFESQAVGEGTIRLLRWMMPYLVLICVGAQLQALANLAGRFFLPAFAPATVNVFWILGACAAAATAGDVPHAEWIAGAVLVAGVAQLGLQWWDLRRVGVHIRYAYPWTAGVKAVALRAGPMMVGLSASQVNLLLDRAIAEAWVTGDGAIRHLYLGNRLMQLPLGLLGVALGTAAYPVLARAAARSDWTALHTALRQSLRLAVTLALPAMVGLIVLADPILSLLFEGGEFTREDVAASAECLVAYAPALLFQAAVLLYARAEYARNRQERVVRLSVLAVGVNIVLDLLLVHPLGASGVAWATTGATIVNAWLLHRGLRADGDGPADGSLRKTFIGSAIAAAVMGAVVLVARVGLEAVPGHLTVSWLGIDSPWSSFAATAVGIPVGAAAFFATARWTAKEDAARVSGMLRRRRR